MNRKTMLVLLVVVLVLVLGWLVMQRGKKTPVIQKTVQTTKNKEQKKTEITPLPVTQKPENFPEDLPLEQSVAVTENYNGVSAEGKKIALREYISKKSMDENFEMYKKYLSDQGYKLETEFKDQENQIVSGTKNDYRLRVRVFTLEKETRVAINYNEM